MERGLEPIFTKTLLDNKEINDTIFQIIKESKFLLICSSIGGLQITHKHFLDINRKILRAYKAGKRDGIKWVMSINDKNDIDLIDSFSKLMIHYTLNIFILSLIKHGKTLCF